jgi:hypothetical protein
VARDYPVMFGTLFVFGLIGLVVGILSDLMYVWSIRASTSRRGRPEAMALREDTPPARPRIDPEPGLRPHAARARRSTSGAGAISAATAGGAFWSLIALLVVWIFGLSLFAEFIANDKPILVQYEGGYYTPIFNFYPETEFGGDFRTEAVYRDIEVHA